MTWEPFIAGAIFGGALMLVALSIVMSGKEPTRCGECIHSRIERHNGGEELVCWVRGSHGERVDGAHYCAKGARWEDE